MVGMKKARDLPFASTLCGACRDACPVKIDIPRLLLHQRRKLSEGTDPESPRPPVADKLFAWSYQRIMSGRPTLALFRRMALLAQRLFVREGRIRWRLPFPPFSRWTRARDLPVMAPKTFHQLWDQKLSKER